MKKFIFSITILLFILISSFFISIHFYRNSMFNTESIALSELKLTASEIAGKISFILQDDLTNLEWESERLNSFKDTKSKFDEIDRVFKVMSRNNHNLSNLFFLNKNGTLLHMASNAVGSHKISTIGKNFSFRQYFKQAKATGKITVSNIIDVKNAENSGYKTIVIAMPMKTKDGKFNGVLGSNINLKELVSDIKFNSPTPIASDEIIKFFFLSKNDGLIVSGPESQNIGKPIRIINAEQFINLAKNLSSDGNRSISAIVKGTKGKMIVGASIIYLKDIETPYVLLIAIPYKKISHQLFMLYCKLTILFCIIFIAVIIIMYTLISSKNIIIRQKKEIQKLEILIDKEKSCRSIKEIEETEYFKTLSEKAEILKKNNYS